MGAHSLSPCIQFEPVVGLLESAWKRKCALFLCTRGGLRDNVIAQSVKTAEITAKAAVQIESTYSITRKKNYNARRTE